MRVRFTAEYGYVPTLDPRAMIVFKPNGGPDRNGIYTVKRECGEAAIAAGAAVEIAAAVQDNARQDASEA